MIKFIVSDVFRKKAALDPYLPVKEEDLEMRKHCLEVSFNPSYSFSLSQNLESPQEFHQRRH